MIDENEKLEPNSTTFIAFNIDTIGRFSSANSEYIKGYTGIDQNTGEHTRLGHKKISSWKITDERNIKQQAGYAAEVLKVSRDNAENIINGSEQRTIRTDDHPSFGVNDTKADHIELDSKGNIIPGSSSQMKFVSISKEKEILMHIACGEGGGKNDLSRYQDVKIDLPTERVDGAKQYCRDQAASYEKQAQELKKQGNLELSQKKQQQADNFRKLENNIRDSKITREEAIFYREHPEVATLTDVAITSHRAGLEGGKNAAVIGATISTAQALYALTKGEMEIDEALEKVFKSTTKAATTGYMTTAGTSALKAFMEQMPPDAVKDLYTAGKKMLPSTGQISASEMLKIENFSKELSKKCNELSKTSLPSLIVSTAVELGPLIYKFSTGKISGEQFFTSLGQSGSNMLAGTWGATWGAVVGQTVIPFPGLGAAIGGVVGSLVCTTISSILYSGALADLKLARQAKKDAELAKSQYEEFHKIYLKYSIEMERKFNEFYNYLETSINKSLSDIKNSVQENNVEKFDQATQGLASTLNVKLEFNSVADFKAFALAHSK